MPLNVVPNRDSLKKTLFINRFFHPDHSATSQILSDLAFDLAAGGMAVEVITSRLRYDDASAQLPAQEVIDGVQVHRVWTSRFGRAGLAGRAVDYITFYLSAAWRLWRRADRNTTVVIKTDPPLMAVVAVPVAWLRGARWVNWLQDLFPEVASALGVKVARGPLMRVMKTARNATLRGAYANVVLGDRMAERLKAEAGTRPLANISIIPNWADGQAIQPVARDSNPLRVEWGLQGRFVVGYSGNLGRAHEFDTFLGAAQALRSRPEIVFLFIGGGAQRATVEAAVRELRLSNITFRPYQPRDRLSQSLGVADVHLVSLNPALEGLIVPSKFYGIAAAGRPTLFVGDTAGEIPMLLRQADCGFAVASGDAATLAHLIAQLAEDPTLCAAQGVHARHLLTSRFDKALALKAWRKALV